MLGLIAGVKTLQQGQLEVLGGSIQDRRHRNSLYPRIAFMPQGLGGNLYPELSISENIQFFATLFGLSKAECDQRRRSLLLATDLLRFADRPAGKLSGGMKQKLGLCCALIHEPDLLILDEPTTGVDPLSRRRFWELVDDVRSVTPATDAAGGHGLHGGSRAVRTLPDARPRQTDRRRPQSANWRQSTPSGKLDEAFTHFQGDGAHDNQPLVIPPRENANADIAIEAHDLTLRFGDFTAVDKVSFAIGRGEIFGFLGSNGCGKTTTMKVLTGLMPATEGSATLLGNPVNAKDLATRKRVGFMSQSFSLYGELSVRQNLVLHAQLFDLPKADSGPRIDELIQRFDLSDDSRATLRRIAPRVCASACRWQWPCCIARKC